MKYFIYFLLIVSPLRIQNDALNGKTDTEELEKNLNELRDYIKK